MPAPSFGAQLAGSVFGGSGGGPTVSSAANRSGPTTFEGGGGGIDFGGGDDLTQIIGWGLAGLLVLGTVAVVVRGKR